MKPRELLNAPVTDVAKLAAAAAKDCAGAAVRKGRDALGPRLTRRNLLGAGVAAAGAAAAAGLGLQLLKRPAPKGIVLIVIDALSKDRVGYVAQTAKGAVRITPYLDFLAETGASFDMAISPSSHTAISMPSILYDTPPFRVGYTQEGLRVNGAGLSLASKLVAQGWFTGAVISNRPIDTPLVRTGFMDFIAVERDMHAPTVRASLAPISGPAMLGHVKRMCRLLRSARPERFFLYVHYMHTHGPYQCADKNLSKLGSSYNAACTPGRLMRAVDSKRELFSPGLPVDKALEILRAQYDAAAMDASDTVRRNLALLDDEGLLSRSLVIVTADHGEERGFPNNECAATFGHARNVSLNETHVPLIVWSPEGSVKGRFDQPASNARVINDVCSAYADGSYADAAASLTASVRAMPPIVSHLDLLRPEEGFSFRGFAVTNGNLRVLGDYAKGPVVRSAFQLGGTAGTREVALASLPKSINDFVAVQLTQGRVEGINPAHLSQEDIKKLRALGYIR